MHTINRILYLTGWVQSRKDQLRLVISCARGYKTLCKSSRQCPVVFLPCYALESLVLLKLVLQIVLLDKMTGEEWMILQWNMDFLADSAAMFSCVQELLR